MFECTPKYFIFFMLKILLVDDNAINQFLGKKIFSKLGYEVQTANDGQEAVDYCSNNEVDLIFMDLQMPIMDGISASILILEKMSKKPIIVALTASLFEAERLKCLEAGMMETLVKPFKIEEIQKILAKYF